MRHMSTNSSRFQPPLLGELHGFHLTDTGGGVEQLVKAYQDGEQCIISSSDGEVPERLDQEMMICYYGEQNQCLHTGFAADFMLALNHAWQLRPEPGTACAGK